MRILRHHGREQVGLAISLLASIITFFNLVEYLGGPGTGSLAPVIIPGLVSLSNLLSLRIETDFSYWLQCGVLAAVALLLALLGEGQQPIAAVLLALAFAMFLQYRLIRFSRGFLLVSAFLIVPFFIVGGIINHSLASSVVLSLSIFGFTLVLWWVFGAELRHSEQRANQVSAMGQLAVSILQAGHEARYHLALMRSRSLGVREHPSDARLHKMLSSIAERLDGELTTMMSYARASSELLKEYCELGVIVHSVVWISSCLPQFRHLVRFEDTIGTCWQTVAALEFRTAVENLVHNAAESVLISGRLGSVRVSCDSQKLVVEDDGDGMQTCVGCTGTDCLVCAHFQVDKSAKVVGSGLGVLQVQDFCRAHGFGLSYHCQKGSGTRVTIDFSSGTQGESDGRV